MLILREKAKNENYNKNNHHCAGNCGSVQLCSRPSRCKSQQWTIPVGGDVGKVFHVGKQPINTSLRAYYNTQVPRSGADWQLQLQISLLFPK